MSATEQYEAILREVGVNPAVERRWPYAIGVVMLDQRGMTNAEVARRACMSPSSLSRYLNGEPEIPYAQQLAIARALGIDWEYLLGVATGNQDLMTRHEAEPTKIPLELIEAFRETTFCAGDAVDGHPESGLGWNTLRIEFQPRTESDYAETLMFYDYQSESDIARASRHFATWSGRHDGQFIKALVDWFQANVSNMEGATDA